MRVSSINRSNRVRIVIPGFPVVLTCTPRPDWRRVGARGRRSVEWACRLEWSPELLSVERPIVVYGVILSCAWRSYSCRFAWVGEEPSGGGETTAMCLTRRRWKFTRVISRVPPLIRRRIWQCKRDVEVECVTFYRRNINLKKNNIIYIYSIIKENVSASEIVYLMNEIRAPAMSISIMMRIYIFISLII